MAIEGWLVSYAGKLPEHRCPKPPNWWQRKQMGLKRGAILQCEGCHKFLVYEDGWTELEMDPARTSGTKWPSRDQGVTP